MNDTLHPSGSISCASASLQRSLESKLRTLLAKGGSTLCSLNWSKKDTPVGRQYCQLSASALRTFATDCSLWPTPTTKYGPANPDTLLRRAGEGELPFLDLQALPRMFDARTWGLTHLVNGDWLNGSSQLMANTGRPNPELHRWLMGFPATWGRYAPTEMLSSHKSPRSSSPRSYKQSARPSKFSGKELWPTCDVNPRKEGTWGHKSYSIIMDRPGIRYEEFLEAGGRLNDLQWDFARGRIELK